MNNLRTKTLLSLCLLLGSWTISPSLHADEGMWLLPLVKQQNYAKMKAMGLKLSPEQLYNTNGDPMLMDAVVLFDGGCTGEVVSPQGLVLTNHHCGYDRIQAHSSVDHNYLRDGFYAPTLSDELPNPGMNVIFTEEIIDLTDYVRAYADKDGEEDLMVILSQAYLQKVADRWYREQRGEPTKGLRLDLKPFFEGNKYYLYLRREYRDIRLVAAPPSSIGKFGADTDNWTWPRHTGDFSVFRIYTAPDGSPAEYAPENVPLKPKNYLRVDLRGVKPDDFVMIMGHPGTTNHFYTAPEVGLFHDVDNAVRIEMRGIRQQAMLEEMLRDEEINIRYAAKYANSTNGHKRAIGSNWAIDKLDFVGRKAAQMEQLRKWAAENNHPEYIEAMAKIDDAISRIRPYRYTYKLLNEGLIQGSELVRLPLIDPEEFERLKADEQLLDDWIAKEYLGHFNGDYSAEVDKKVTKAVLKVFQEKDKTTGIFSLVEDTDRYLDEVYATTIYRDPRQLKAAIRSYTYDQYLQDPAVMLATYVRQASSNAVEGMTSLQRELTAARHLYVQGIMQMSGEESLWPDANLTLRYTFGTVKGYSPRDEVFYGPMTTTEGVLEKVVPGDYEFDLQPEIVALYRSGEFGRFARPDGKMPVNFCATTHTTGGNSGSPVINGEGYLVGLNFDRNWEGVGGDIIYLPDYQRSIICDIRYVVFVLDRVLGADRLTSELQCVR